MTTKTHKFSKAEIRELCMGDVFLAQSDRLRVAKPKVKDVMWINSSAVFIDECKEFEKRRCTVLVDQLLLDIYANYQASAVDYNSGTSSKSTSYTWLDRHDLMLKDLGDLKLLVENHHSDILRTGSILVRRLKRRDALRRQRDARYDVISFLLRKRVPEFSPEMRFSLEPLPGDSGFSQWHSAMKMVSQLPEGIPPEFRRQLWLSLADKHLQAKGIDWAHVERNCFSEWSHPSDGELGVQIVKDLHRTGCSLFCGKDGKENQALLKRVLLAYARWNKAVGYCQGFNMLAALILQVTEKSESDALKLMIYLIEGVLPDSYFADSLRGLSVDMAVFRELLRSKLPKLSNHLDTLQVASKEGTTSYEPPLTNVFTMQWFLTLFCNCLPQPTVLRVWDLILLEGNEILLRTSLAIWQVLADRIMTAKSADEFYCVMGVLMREILEYDLISANTLIKGIVTIGPLTELSSLREHYLYNINPWGCAPPTAGARNSGRSRAYPKDNKLVLDIGVLKKQYTKLKQRQRQAHIIFNSAVTRQAPRPPPVAVNHLLLGKSALVPAKRMGPPKGAIPPPRQKPKVEQPPPPAPRTLLWKDTQRRSSSSSSSSSSDTELCDDPDDDGAATDDELKSQLPDDNLPQASESTSDTSSTTIAAPVDVATSKEVDDLTNNQSIINQSDSDKQEALMIFSDNIPLADFVVTPQVVSSITTPIPAADLLEFVEPPNASNSATNELFSMDAFQPLEYVSCDDSTLRSDIFDNTDCTNNDYFNVDIKRSDSLPSEDGFDFEKFLEERVKSLKVKPYSSDESLDDISEQERTKYANARKNSVRALEIIQENSLILHRILQCQSRLTPTPPPCDDAESGGGLTVSATIEERDADGKEANYYFNEGGNEEEDDITTPTNQPQNSMMLETLQTPQTSQYANFSTFIAEKYDENIISPTSDTHSTYITAVEQGDEETKQTTMDSEMQKYLATDYGAVQKEKDDFNEFFVNVDEINIGDDIMLSQPKVGNESKIDGEEDEDTAYINQFISKYNYISKRNHANEDEKPDKEETKTTDILLKSSHIDELPPSTTHNVSSIIEVDYNLEKYRHKLGSPLDDDDDNKPISSERYQTSDESESHSSIMRSMDELPTQELIEIDKNSKYNSILEYSRNLDEKFNNLILRSPKLTRLQTDKLLKSNYSLDVPESPGGDLNCTSSQHEDKPKPSQSYTDFRNSSAGNLITTTEVDQSAESIQDPVDVDALIESPNLKSPNRIYNPFPVNISSRQNKEVPFRLGLYKK